MERRNIGELTDFQLSQQARKIIRWSSSKTKRKRVDQMSVWTSIRVSQKSYKSIRSAINRHLQDLGRDIDIIQGKNSEVLMAFLMVNWRKKIFKKVLQDQQSIKKS